MLELDIKNTGCLKNIITPIMARGTWRKQFEWSISPVKIGTKKYTGLKNLAATGSMEKIKRRQRNLIQSIQVIIFLTLNKKKQVSKCKYIIQLRYLF